MNDATRTILIALGGALILLVLVPMLVTMGMMMVGSVLIVASVGRRPRDRR